MEGEKFAPKDVVEQTGLNKGNISDPELAQVGAEAEKKTRDFLEDHPAAELASLAIGGPDDVANRMGEKALYREVSKRARESAKSKGATPGDAKSLGEQALQDFITEQSNKSYNRNKGNIE